MNTLTPASVTTTTTFELTDAEIREALIEYVGRRQPTVGHVIVHITPDTSWEAEGKGMYYADVTFTNSST